MKISIDDNRSKGFFFYLKPFPLSIRVMKFFYIPFHFIFTAELWFQCFQLQAALHVIPGKCSTKNAARGAAKLSIGCV